jgi:hypothetical protein
MWRLFGRRTHVGSSDSTSNVNTQIQGDFRTKKWA